MAKYNPSTSQRNRILQRDNHACRVCGCQDSLELDHVKPESKNGSNRDSNLQVLCGVCNRLKSDLQPVWNYGKQNASMTECRRQFSEACENQKNTDFFELVDQLKSKGLRKATIRKRLESKRYGHKKIMEVMKTI